ncbi:anti-anti-sigma factor [Mycobacterium kyorinense]|uniref:Anti-anti-sigma factor n=1 Tax=Mycobacterium kyorinense TaxID=487514 RepID=A0A1A2Z469_9MYCO|nr:STAS domain-containing protein [Mycobacterium kyorinense]OBI44468.1 anti-anti-sigma factor [Mycobacterium kyorinense]
MPTPLTLDTAGGNDGQLVLIAVGEIDLSNVATFTRSLTAAITENAGSTEKITVDLSAVEYLDSAAINVLFNHAEHIHLIVRPLLIRVLTVSGLTELTTVESASPKAEH